MKKIMSSNAEDVKQNVEEEEGTLRPSENNMRDLMLNRIGIYETGDGTCVEKFYFSTKDKEKARRPAHYLAPAAAVAALASSAA